jgi:hypothetical protein
LAQIGFRCGLEILDTMPAAEVILLAAVLVDVPGLASIYIHAANRISFQLGRGTRAVCGVASVLVHRRIALSCSIVDALYWIHPAHQAGISRSSYRRVFIE